MNKPIKQLNKLRNWRVFMGACIAALAIGGLAFMVWPFTATVAPKVKWTPNTPFAVPAIIDDGWEREDVATAGFDASQLYKVLEDMMNGESNIHSVVVERHGKLVAELYRRGKDKKVNSFFAHEIDFGPKVVHDTRSVGKSIISLLLGIARQQGKIKSLQTPVIDFYTEYTDLATPERKAITLEHLLTMSSGLEWSEGGGIPDDEHHLMWKWSPYYYVLSRPIASKPGHQFNYNSGGTAVLADILTRVTETPWNEYARKSLFEPLDIHDLEWVGDFHGRPMCYTGLRMRPRDMAKIGRLVLNHGKWQGQQIIPEDWIAASLQPRLSTGFDGTQYGYQWWIGTVEWKGQQLQWGAAFGNGSQRVFVVPSLDMTVVITAGAYNDIQVARRVNAFFREIVSTLQNDLQDNTVSK
ncbi:MAG: serine hydrolase [Acidobacteriota bacterium]